MLRRLPSSRFALSSRTHDYSPGCSFICRRSKICEKGNRSNLFKPGSLVHHNIICTRKLDDFSSLRSFSASTTSLAKKGPIADSERTVEEQYSRKTPLEHVLLRPGMYVGPVERLPPSPCWVLDSTQTSSKSSAKGRALNAQARMVRKEYGLVPALNKVFDEILVNASDNRLRYPTMCTRLDVIIDPGGHDKDAFVSIFNDGKGIPVHMHKEANLYVPEMLFGHLLTGSNFDDNEKRITGGRHGYGAKLTNIFSKQFSIETVDSLKGLRYEQKWSDNMSSVKEPVITKLKEGESDYTCVTFVPDLPKLMGDSNAAFISPEDYAVMCRRVLDVAGCAAGQLKVTLNGQDVSMANFEEYSQMYRSEKCPPLVYHKLHSRFEIGVGLSNAETFESVSFVNGMATTRGGTHVDVIAKQVTKQIAEKIAKLEPGLGAIRQGLIRQHLFISCNALIENPTFDSQMKESLTSHPNSFGKTHVLPQKVLTQITKAEKDGGPGIVEQVVRAVKGRQHANLLSLASGKKKPRRLLLDIPKLEDAHLAGTAERSECTLILTEGDSAKALAVAGLEIIGRNHNGVFPLRGKFLNVRHASAKQLTDNAEVKALCNILALDFKKDYDTIEERATLRYGHVMFMTDQDNDGSHIKGLLLNFVRYFWPKLLQPLINDPSEKPFLSSFVTPLLKVSKKGKETIPFYSIAEYNEWRSSLESGDDIRKWKVKYYKGLGTSTPTEAKEYFKAFSNHYRPFRWNSDLDGELLDMAFDKERAEDRKQWIIDEYDQDSSITVDTNRENAVTYEDFINNELVHYSNASNVRSLPSAVDGLKPSQRKVLYACFKRKLKSEVKVAQLAGYCAEHSAYHHGEASLQSTIISMAQDFVGSNNINLLTPCGQFGTRFTGGKDAASPRYVFTHLSPVARYLFPEADDVLLKYREDDGQQIEPEYYCPIIPLLLVNGHMGIGTGWSTSIPPHNPYDVLSYIRAKLDQKQELPHIGIWARGFSGTIESKGEGQGYASIGKVKMLPNNKVLISELPIGKWTDAYKAVLIKLRDDGEIRSFTEDHTTSSVSFTVRLTEEQLLKIEEKGLEKGFKLEKNMPTTNMHAFDAKHNIQKFGSAESIADAFFPIRLALYEDRKSVLHSEMNYRATMFKSKARFISAVIDGSVHLTSGNKTEEETVGILQELGFAKMSDLKKIRNDNTLARRSQHEDDANTDESDDSIDPHREYDYLFNMPLSSLTTDKIESLHDVASKTDEELAALLKTSPKDLWKADLDILESHFESVRTGSSAISSNMKIKK